MHCVGKKNMDHNLFYESSCVWDVLIRYCHCQTRHVWRRTQRLSVPDVCVSIEISPSRYGRWAYVTNPMCVCVPIEIWLIIAVHWQSYAIPPTYPSPKKGQMHEQEMMSLNLVVGNGIRKHWPFVGSLRPQCESHDSRIFTVPPVTGLVKSQHTSLKSSGP